VHPERLAIAAFPMLGMRRSRRSGRLYVHVQPADKALQKTKGRVS